MSGYNPNASMLPASGGNIVAMSGGGGPPVSDLRSETGLPLDPLSSKDVRQQGSGAGLVFANGGSRKRKLRQKQTGGDPPVSTASSASSVPVSSDPNNIDDILTKLIGSLPKTKGTYTNEEQDNLLKNLTLLLNSDTNKKFRIEIK
jgi:hypothetical protein